MRYKDLFLYSLPSIFASALEPVAGAVDTAFVGNLSTNWLATLGASVAILSSFGWVFNFLVHGTTAEIGQDFGAGKTDRISHQVWMALITASALGILASLFLLIGGKYIFKFMGMAPNLFEEGSSYFFTRVFGFTGVLLMTVITGIVRGLGAVRLQFILGAILTLSNIILTYLFLFPMKLGLIGAAYGTVGSYLIGCSVGLLSIYFLCHKHGVNLFIVPKISFDDWKVFGGNGINIFFRSLALVSSYFLATSVASHIGKISLAAHQVIMELWLLASFLIDGFAISANILGAQKIGRKDFKDLKVIYSQTLRMGFGVGIGFGLGYFLLRPYIQDVFSNDIVIFRQLDLVWPILCIAQPINALAFVYDGILFGAKEFRFIKGMMVKGFFFCFLPLLSIAFYTKSFPLVLTSILGYIIFRAVSAWRRTLEITSNPEQFLYKV